MRNVEAPNHTLTGIGKRSSKLVFSNERNERIPFSGKFSLKLFKNVRSAKDTVSELYFQFCCQDVEWGEHEQYLGTLFRTYNTLENGKFEKVIRVLQCQT